MNSETCEIVIVRHGQTVANNTGVLQGQSNSPLDETGQAQARAAAKRLAGEKFDAVFASDLGRTMETAEIILQAHPGMKAIPMTELREWNLGVLQGRTYADLTKEYPEVMAAFKTANDTTCVPGGESLLEFQQRVAGFLDRIAAEYPGKRLLFITHGGTTQRIFRHVVGQIAPGNIQPLCANASLSVIQHLPIGWRLVTWNDTAHLSDLKLHETLTY